MCVDQQQDAENMLLRGEAEYIQRMARCARIRFQNEIRV